MLCQVARHEMSKDKRMCYVYTLFSELSKHMKFKPSCAERKLCVPVEEELKYAVFLVPTQMKK
jgi:hypothetical protein